MHRQIAKLARADLDECLENTTGWGVGFCDQENDRIRVSGNKELDDMVVYEHHLYKATGSIEAQARIDSYIIPCIVYKTFGEPFGGNLLRNRIPGYLWSEMTRRTDTMDTLQYHTLPDLGVYIRERMVSQSSWVPTSLSSSSISQQQQQNEAQIETPSKSNQQQQQQVGCVTAFAHSCCSVTAPQARNDSVLVSTVDSPVSLPESCTTLGCIHGSILSLILGA